MNVVPLNMNANCDTTCDPVLRAGNTNCAGCGMSIGLQWFSEVFRDSKPILAIPACCGIVTAGAFPTSAYSVPIAATTFASAAAVATGLRSVALMNTEENVTVCWAGDGGTYDIGLATLSAAAERNEDIIYICYDNEIYGNTGGQRSSATPEGVVTSTTTSGKSERKKDIMAIMAAHHIPYAATLSVAHREDFIRKLEIAKKTKGFRFLLMLSPCPTGWKSEPEDGVDLIRYAVRCGLFPLYEVYDGDRYRINVERDQTSIEEYITRQRRYTKGSILAEELTQLIDARWQKLKRIVRAFPADDNKV